MSNPNLRRTLIVLLAGAATAVATNADTIHVCWDGSGDYLTIQEGIDAASDGDEIVVCDGTYTGNGNRDIDFGGKAITVRSENGPEGCIIDCQGSASDPHRGFCFQTQETSAATLDGFTIQHGYLVGGSLEEYGGAILCYSSSPRILNTVLRWNWAEEDGGGVYCLYSSPELDNCTISDNAAGDFGGGIAFHNSSATVTDCVIEHNVAQEGGGIHLRNGNVTISACTISNNMAQGDEWSIGFGGGVRCDNDMTVLVDCIISENTARWGGGLYKTGAPEMHVANCRIVGNAAEYQGGGVLCYLGTWPGLTFSNCIITGNACDWYGGGVWCGSGGLLEFSGCTVSQNVAGWYGGGMYCYSQTRAAIANSILWGNMADYGSEIALDDQSRAIVSYSDVPSSPPATFIWGSSFVVWLDGNIDADPLFVDPDGPDDDPNTWEDNDYHLTAASPCIDGGDPNFVPDPADRDIDGQWRVWDGDQDDDWRVDMGSDEFGSHCPGDLDGDDDIDLGDLAGLLAHYGTTSGMTPADGDFDLDGDIDLSDLSALLAVYGTICEG